MFENETKKTLFPCGCLEGLSINWNFHFSPLVIGKSEFSVLRNTILHIKRVHVHGVQSILING